MDMTTPDLSDTLLDRLFQEQEDDPKFMGNSCEPIATLDGTSWYWCQPLGIVIGYQDFAIRVFQMRKANTRVNALRMICHRYLGMTS